MDAAQAALDKGTQGVADAAGKLPGMESRPGELCYAIGTLAGKVVLAMVIVLILWLLWRALIKCPLRLAVVKASKPCPPCPGCSLDKLGYIGPVTVDGDHVLHPGQNVSRRYNNTCFDSFDLSYTAGECPM